MIKDKKVGAIVAAVSMIAAMGIGSSVAFADGQYVGGQLNTSGALVQYSTTRTHTFSGPIALYVDNMPSGYLRLGLRNMNAAGGPQFTNSLQWNARGSQQWDNILVNTRFAMQGRMQAYAGGDNVWGGQLTY